VKRTLAIYSIAAFWLVMAAVFFRREVLPTLFEQPMPPYSSVRTYAQTHPESRMTIFGPNQARIGSVRTTYQIRPDGSCEISSRTEIDAGKLLLQQLLGNASGNSSLLKFQLWSEFTIGPDDALESLSVFCDGGPLPGSARGVVIGDRLHLTVNFPGFPSEMVIPVTREDIFSSQFVSANILPHLRVGQVWQFRTFDPRRIRFAAQTARVLRKTALNLGGHNYPVYEIRLGGDDMLASHVWVDESGEVLKEEVLNLITLVRTPLPHEINVPPSEISPPVRAR